MNDVYKDISDEVTCAIIDINAKKLIDKTKLTSEHLPLITAEALSFMEIWDKIEK